MSDYLVELGKKDAARKAVKTLGIPIPLPQDLARATGPLESQPLADLHVVVGHGPKAELAQVLASTVCGAGAYPIVAADKKQYAAYEASGEAWGRHPAAVAMDAAPDVKAPHALVFDATAAKDPAALFDMYAFFHSKLRALAPNGRVLVLGRPPEEATTVEAAAAGQALVGFAKSVGKEIGKKGATANAVFVSKGAEDRLEPVVRFFLSRRSVYVDGQFLTVTNDVKAPEQVFPVRPLDTKTALVTGAAQGIGKAIALALAAEGARVICMDRPAEEERTARLAEEIGGTALHLDITAPDATDILVDHVKSGPGKIDIIVHNAGVTRDKMLVNMDDTRWNMAINVNLVAVMAATRALEKYIPADGRVVCLSSIAGIAGNAGQTNYAASKAGVIGFVRAFAPALAKKGVAINAVAPGFIETRMTAAIPLATREAGRRLSSLSQGGLPEDVAQVVTFLSMPQAAGVTGQVVRICGQNFIGA